jgi:hypothetical protein
MVGFIPNFRFLHRTNNVIVISPKSHPRESDPCANARNCRLAERLITPTKLYVPTSTYGS